CAFSGVDAARPSQADRQVDSASAATTAAASLQWAMVIDRSSLRPCPACRGALPGKERPGRRAMEREWRAAGPGAGSEIDLDAGAHRPAVEFLLAEQAGATDIGAVRRIVHVGALQEHADLRA